VAPEWYDIAVRNLDQGDEISKSYPLKLNDNDGYLLFSNKKVLFVHGEGLFRKKYELTFKLPYEKIESVSKTGKYELDITDVEGGRHKIKTFEISASRIEETFKAIPAA
jgi:hypothetical protein